jgi:hypothetical protein
MVAAVAEVAVVAEVADAWRTELKSVGLALTLMKRAMAKSYFERIISESDLFSVLVRSEVAEVAEVADVWRTELKSVNLVVKRTSQSYRRARSSRAALSRHCAHR